MKRILFFVAISLSFTACKDQSVFVPDNSTDLQKLSGELQLQTDITAALQDLVNTRLDNLEGRVTDLENRMTVVEGNVDLISADIASLFTSVSNLEAADIAIRDEICDLAKKMRKADRKTRALLTARFNELQRDLSREIKKRKLADKDLQDQIDDQSDEFDQFTAQQTIINGLLTFGLALTNFKITVLTDQLKALSKTVKDNQDAVKDDLAKIKTQISKLKSNIADIGNELDDVKDQLISAVYPCGDENEALLKTPDGLLGVFSVGSNKTLTITDTDTIPEHAVCDKVLSFPLLGLDKACLKATQVPAKTVTQSTSVSYFSLDYVKLLALPNGTYNAADGWSCTFEVQNGEVVQ